ncbi:MAG: acetyl-CoA carboxylase biotin carboxyl carrier protein [Alphaproteobacteria bacterium]
MRKNSPTNIDGAAVRQLAELLDETGLTEIEYEANGMRLRVARVAAQVAAAPVVVSAPAVAAPMASAAPAAFDASHPGVVTSPMVGTVYLSPDPNAPPFIKTGDTVRAGQTLLLVEAMKTFNEIKAHRAGTITQILVESGKPVEFGEVLVVIS